MPGKNRPSQTPEGVKARQLRLVAKAPKVKCECGCGKMIPSIHRSGGKRRFHEGFRGPYPRASKKEPTTKVNAKGYVLEYVDGRWRRQHRLVWEREHGELGDLVIHHVNGDRGDNRITNLRAMTQGEHMTLHAEIDRLVEENCSRAFAQRLAVQRMESDR